MAELKPLGRAVAQPSAPDISAAGQAYGVLGKAIQGVAKTAGEYVKATRELEESTLTANATNDIEKAFIEYKNNPNIDMKSFESFNQQMDATIQGYTSAAPDRAGKEFYSGFETIKKKYSNKALDATLQQSIKNETRDISLSINETQKAFITQISDGDLESAATSRQELAKMVQALAVRGVSANKIIEISDSTDSLAIAAQATSRLKKAGTLEARTEIMKELSSLPDTPVNTKAFNLAYSDYTKLNKLYAEAADLSIPLQNSLSGNSWNNLDLDKKDSNALVDLVVKGSVNKNPAPQQPQQMLLYQAVPSYPGQAPTYDYSEEVQAEREGRKPNRYLVEGIVKSEETQLQREPTLFDLAQAHVFVGSKNATEFPSAVTKRLFAGNGALANEAVEAINFVETANSASLELPSNADIIYTEFKIAKDSGRTDYDKMIGEARKAVAKISPSDLKLKTDLYNSMFSTSGSGLKNLNKEFKNATGIDGIKTNSTKALSDYNHILKTKYLTSDASLPAILDSAKRQISRAHGQDAFTGGRYISFPPSKMLQGLTENQIGNQFLLQIVNHGKNNPDLTFPEHYNRIKTATEDERMLVNLAGEPVPREAQVAGFSARLGGAPEIRVTQNIEGLGHITGTVFVKPNEFTEQNNSGMPVWEAWMRDDMGREFPIIDNNSPHKNILLIFGKTAQEFAPNYTKMQNEEKVEEAINQALVAEGREIYSGWTLNPATFAHNLMQRKAYREELNNKERVGKKVRKILGKEGQ